MLYSILALVSCGVLIRPGRAQSAVDEPQSVFTSNGNLKLPERFRLGACGKSGQDERRSILDGSVMVALQMMDTYVAVSKLFDVGIVLIESALGE